jgi:hypothetical protein
MTNQPLPQFPRLIFRVAIVVMAALALYWFSDGSALALEVLTPPIAWRPWFTVPFAILVGIVAPLCALVAAGLAIAGKRLGLAVILLCVGMVAYYMPPATTVVGIMIYGF